MKRKHFVATWECVVTESDGDSVWCDAYMLGHDEQVREFWEVEVPGNKWTEGHAFYVLRSMKQKKGKGMKRFNPGKRLPMTDHDWLQIEAAAAGIEGTSDDHPDLVRAINKLRDCTLGGRKSSDWLRGFCEGVLAMRNQDLH